MKNGSRWSCAGTGLAKLAGDPGDAIAWREFVFGLITRKDLFLHPVTVYRDYGWRVLVMGLFRHRGTFLELVARHAVNIPIPSAGHDPDQDTLGIADTR